MKVRTDLIAHGLAAALTLAAVTPLAAQADDATNPAGATDIAFVVEHAQASLQAALGETLSLKRLALLADAAAKLEKHGSAASEAGSAEIVVAVSDYWNVPGTGFGCDYTLRRSAAAGGLTAVDGGDTCR